eukprot:CAMPEP_0202864212 /NCGR_PEP_ID=MMETSP1391-20130828/4547_1 /ASSEMBLY_ACC=CAM_ASM_000867 /TAXON_ID=1034604 /ORGANISM="Chlamydomonas leiostraca, Strain SAG 11-49" /LENGTH=166 /DNA_ID=CAMNT_0049543935 /DNA_START=177 /DNA_END=677 /DNA_ORIENTATION=-
MVWLAFSGELAPMPAAVQEVLGRSAVVNAPFLVFLLYSAFYLILEPVAGLTWAACVGLPMWITSTQFAAANPQHGWQIALGVHVFSWYMQIHPGHAVFEGRKPALLDSLVQAFALAPLFVWFEALFLLGYRRRLQQQLEVQIDKEVAKAGRAGGGGQGKAGRARRD